MDKFEIEKKLEELSDRISPDEMSEINKQEVMAELDAILSSDPQNTDAYFWKGLVYEIDNDYDNAIAMYEEILKINPDDKQAKESIANCTDYIKWDLDKNKRYSELSKNTEKEAPDLLEKVSIWHILIFKAIVIAILIYVIIS